MKLREIVLEQFEDIQLGHEFSAPPNRENNYQLSRTEHQQWVHEKRKALDVQDTHLMRRLEAIMDNNPDDVFFMSNPSQHDPSPSGHWMDKPKAVEEHPEQFAQFESPGTWFDEDLATKENYNGHEDPWDDVSETYFVRKSKPSMVKAVGDIINGHNRIVVSLRNSWRWK